VANWEVQRFRVVKATRLQLQYATTVLHTGVRRSPFRGLGSWPPGSWRLGLWFAFRQHAPLCATQGPPWHGRHREHKAHSKAKAEPEAARSSHRGQQEEPKEWSGEGGEGGQYDRSHRTVLYCCSAMRRKGD
jgi:hypothetical protein